ncbi:MAG TPA: hypothetical protein ENN73_03875 [Firmicutes bacterium]|nr:hypothetical protein [Bacillota bacterium]
MKRFLILIVAVILVFNFVFGEGNNEEKEQGATEKKIESLREKQNNKEELKENKTKGIDDMDNTPFSVRNAAAKEQPDLAKERVLNKEKESFGSRVLRILGFKKDENGKDRVLNKDKEQENKILNAQDMKRPSQVIKDPGTPDEKDKEEEQENYGKKGKKDPGQDENVNDKIERQHKSN